MNEAILEKIKALPPLDDTVVKIQSICIDKNSSLGELSDVISKDPMLTANILKAANSPLYGFSREVKNISHAVSLFGMSTVRGFALSSVIRQNIKIDLSPYDLSNQDFLDITSLQSALMLNWYGKIEREMLDILVPASFLMEVGKLILSHEIKERKLDGEFKEKIKTFSTTAQISEYENEIFGFDNEQITAKIFEQWNLEIELVEAIRFSGNPNLAPEHLQPYSLALQVIKTAVNIYDRLSERSIGNSLKLIRHAGLDEDLFLKAKEIITP